MMKWLESDAAKLIMFVGSIASIFGVIIGVIAVVNQFWSNSNIVKLVGLVAGILISVLAVYFINKRKWDRASVVLSHSGSFHRNIFPPIFILAIS